MSFYSQDLVEEIRARSDIVDVISSYIKLQRKGSNYVGVCPFHNDRNPSMSVNQPRQIYHCFSCGAGGDVFKFVMEYENLTFPEAMKVLAERAGISLPKRETSKEARQQADIKAQIMEMNKLAAKFYYYTLRQPAGKVGLDYLLRRQLSQETIHRFGLGYADQYSNSLYQYLKNKGYSDQLLKESGLVQADEKRGMYDKFWNRVIFPIMDIRNRVIGFGGRVMGDGKPKYLNSPETKVFDKSRNLYGLHLARLSRKPNIILCEGYMDVIAMHQAGFPQAVASLGTAFTVQQSAILKRYTNEVLLTYDNDEAGVRAALRAIPILRDAGLSAKIINMEPYKDPDEFIKAMGAESFQKRIDEAESSFSFELRTMERQYDFEEPESKTAFYKALSEKLLTYEQGIERNNYIQAAAKRYHLGYEELSDMVNRIGKHLGGLTRAPAPTKPISQRKRPEDLSLRSQRLLITFMSSEERMFLAVRRYVEPEEFTDPLCRKVAELLEEQQKKGHLNPAALFQYFTEEEDQQNLSAMLHGTPLALSGKEEEKKALQETILRVKQSSIAYQMTHMDPNNVEMLQKIIQKRREIEKLHISLD
ncbi:MAG: DNA primase [Lachnospiraceae bacterium]|jgi:DNA primase|nr:DNA primase [Lachnospiraceae bacterium]